MNKYFKYIIAIIFIVVMSFMGTYFKYRYVTHSLQDVVHCRAKDFDMDYYYVIDGEFYKREYMSNKIVRKKLDGLDTFYNKQLDLVSKYKGYMYNSVVIDDVIFEMTYYDYDLLSNEDLTVLRNTQETMLTDFDKEKDLVINRDGLMQRFGDLVCY